MTSAITAVFEIFLVLKDSIDDSSSRRRRTRSSSGGESVGAVELELKADEVPEKGCVDRDDPEATPFWGSGIHRKSELRGSIASDPKALP